MIEDDTPIDYAAYFERAREERRAHEVAVTIVVIAALALFWALCGTGSGTSCAGWEACL